MVTSRQFPHRMNKDRYRRCRHDAPQLNNRRLAQWTRQNRDHELINMRLAQRAHRIREGSIVQHLPVARRPLSPRPAGTPSLRHRLGRCNIQCSFCGANHWIEERVQGSSKSSPRFSTCCGGGAIVMDKFKDPPEPLFSLLKDTTPSIFLHHIFTDNQWPQNSVEILGTIITPLHSVPLESNRTSLFMALRAYILSVFKGNCIISSAPYFHQQENSLHFHKFTFTIETRSNRHNNGCPIIMICSTSISSFLFKSCSIAIILTLRHF